MARRNPRKPRPPLDARGIEELALAYVGRFATTRAKLRSYLARKLRERGWEGAATPDLQGLADRFAERGYIDDSAYALSKASTLAARGYGKRRLIQSLHVAGVAEEDSLAARDHADEEALSAALRFARRRKFGPFAAITLTEPRDREKALAAMIRAGHRFDLARAIIDLAPGAEINADELSPDPGR